MINSKWGDAETESSYYWCLVVTMCANMSDILYIYIPILWVWRELFNDRSTSPCYNIAVCSVVILVQIFKRSLLFFSTISRSAFLFSFCKNCADFVHTWYWCPFQSTWFTPVAWAPSLITRCAWPSTSRLWVTKFPASNPAPTSILSPTSEPSAGKSLLGLPATSPWADSLLSISVAVPSRITCTALPTSSKTIAERRPPISPNTS